MAISVWLGLTVNGSFGWLLLGFLISTLKNGPGKAGDNIFRLLSGADTLRELLGAEWTDDIKAAWQELLAEIGQLISRQAAT